MEKNFHNSELSEHDLIIGCINDNRRYQEVLYKRYAKTMFGICKRYSIDNDEAMDFLQEGFIEVFKKLHLFKGDGSLEGWIKKVIVYKTIEVLRKRKRLNEIITTEDKYYTNAADFSDMETDVSGDFKRKIRYLINQLPEKAGMILKLYVVEGLTHKEISEHLEISEGTSKSQLNRARNILKSALRNE